MDYKFGKFTGFLRKIWKVQCLIEKSPVNIISVARPHPLLRRASKVTLWHAVFLQQYEMIQSTN